MLSAAQINALRQQGLDALRQGDGAAALSALEKIIDARGADGAIWYATARAALLAGQYTKAHKAIDQILSRERSHVQALITKADIYAGEGDARAASGFYDEALSAAGPEERWPAQIAGELKRARDASDKVAGEMLDHLKQQLKSRGFDETRSSKRFRDSVEMLAGARQRYIEEPRLFCFDGLPQRGFYEASEFDWIADIEGACDDIAAELAAFEERDAFEPYIKSDPRRPQRDHRLLNNRDWGALYLWREGVCEDAVAEHFPKTMAALEAAPLDRIEGRGPMALFSRLAPGARIDPHTGFLNTRLICHLPIVSPGKCALRVGNDIHEWRRGEMCVFNDTIEHEAWNEADATRTILLFSIWRPELTGEERDLVGALLQSVDNYGPG